MKIKQFVFIQKKEEKEERKKKPESGSSPSFEKLTGLFISFDDMRSNLRKVKGHNVIKTFLFWIWKLKKILNSCRNKSIFYLIKSQRKKNRVEN